MLLLLKIIGGLLGAAFALAVAVAVGGLVALLGWLAVQVVRQRKLLVPLAVRSIWSHRIKSLVVGGILALGTFLLVLGTSMLGNIQQVMEKSITGSLIGDVQVVSGKAKDDPVFFGPGANGAQDLGVIAEWRPFRELLEANENVKAVVPMGRDIATAVGGNDFDEAVELLREAVKSGDPAQLEEKTQRMKRIVEVLRPEVENRGKVARDAAEAQRNLEAVTRAASSGFWEEFKTDPETALAFLDSRVAPLQSDSSLVFLPYLGVDIDAFAKTFERFEITSGGQVPSGQRGFLFNQGFYDAQLKNKVARFLDQIDKARREEGRRIATDSALQQLVERNVRQFRRVLLDLQPAAAAGLDADLATFMGMPGTRAEQTLPLFLDVKDDNFDARYAFFYAKIAPHIRLYKVKVGETLTLRAFTKSGYSRAANLKVYGTFTFKGLEGTAVASNYNIVDIMSFRSLYGLMTPERRKELDAIKAEVGVREVARDDAEDSLFGDAAAGLEGSVPASDAPPDAEPVAAPARADSRRALDDKPFTRQDVDDGVVLQAAVVLKDPTRSARTQAELVEQAKAKGLELKSVGWQQASGIVGQLILLLGGVLFTILLIIGLVALVIINNSILMATMDRIGEIGTMRAVGAPRGLVLSMFLLESLSLTVVAAAVGTALAGALIGWWGSAGLVAPSAGNGIFYVMFGGKALYPVLKPVHVLAGFLVIGFVSLVATLYPAFIATRVAPVVAMQRRE
jgi:ABC-type lipoprotein release transport system permease subunit